MELVHELGGRMHAAAQKRARAAADASAAATVGDEAAQTAVADAASAAAELSAQKAAHSAALVGLRAVAQSMGERYQLEPQSSRPNFRSGTSIVWASSLGLGSSSLGLGSGPEGRRH